ncbi:MAG: ATP-binding cassette domain-containing protein [Desulfurococcales archaeon]|nr:ATP-binding cassette domain-containing protein [Desulfurococcales archaeon]
MARVELRGVSISYGRLEVLREVDLRVEEGELYSIIGPNGSGKSTLLKVIAGILKPERGTVRVEGVTSLVPQNDQLLPWMTLLDNIILPLKLRGYPEEEARGKAVEIAEQLGFKEHLSKYPKHASGGTRRKAAISRALIMGAEILLLDEPFTGLDITSSTSLSTALSKLKGRVTIIMVSHQPYEIAELSDRVGVLWGKPATLIEEARLNGLDIGDRIRILRGVISKFQSLS